MNRTTHYVLTHLLALIGEMSRDLCEEWNEHIEDELRRLRNIALTDDAAPRTVVELLSAHLYEEDEDE